MPEYIYMLENPHRSLLVSELNSSSRVIKIRTPNSEKQSSFQLSETQYSVFLQLRDTNSLERDPTIVYWLFPVSLDKTFSAFNNSNYVPLMIYLSTSIILMEEKCRPFDRYNFEIKSSLPCLSIHFPFVFDLDYFALILLDSFHSCSEKVVFPTRVLTCVFRVTCSAKILINTVIMPRSFKSMHSKQISDIDSEPEFVPNPRLSRYDKEQEDKKLRAKYKILEAKERTAWWVVNGEEEEEEKEEEIVVDTANPAWNEFILPTADKLLQTHRIKEPHRHECPFPIP